MIAMMTGIARCNMTFILSWVHKGSDLAQPSYQDGASYQLSLAPRSGRRRPRSPALARPAGFKPAPALAGSSSIALLPPREGAGFLDLRVQPFQRRLRPCRQARRERDVRRG